MQQPSRLVSKLILCGCGASHPTPSMRCLMSPNPCHQCVDASSNPLSSRNKRNNSSLLLQCAPSHSPTASSSRNAGERGSTSVSDEYNSRPTNILIDCGKTFRDAVIRHLIPNGVNHIDAIVLTHHHADAILGLDDVREVMPVPAQFHEPKEGPSNWRALNKSVMPLFCDEKTEHTLKTIFPYLFPKAEEAAAAVRWTGSLQVQRLVNRQTIDVNGLQLTPLSLCHGDCTAFGFLFSTLSGHLGVYISDVGKMTDEEFAWIHQQTVEQKKNIEILFMDCLSRNPNPNPAHFNNVRSFEAAARIGAKETVFIGLGHTIDYEKFERHLRRISTEDMKYRCGFDGLMKNFGSLPR